jgi:plasmid stabilization system protein ParE
MTLDASNDLIHIFDYVEQSSPQNAPSVVRSIFDAIDSLAQLPHRYKVHRSARSPDRVVRSMPVPPFIVYYRILEQEQTVRVLTVRHGAQRQPRRFD